MNEIDGGGRWKAIRRDALLPNVWNEGCAIHAYQNGGTLHVSPALMDRLERGESNPDSGVGDDRECATCMNWRENPEQCYECSRNPEVTDNWRGKGSRGFHRDAGQPINPRCPTDADKPDAGVGDGDNDQVERTQKADKGENE